MKKIICVIACTLAIGVAGVNGQAKKPTINWPDYQFETVFQIPVTPVQNQYRSGTCWCYSGIGFVEAEIIRINNIQDPAKYPALSEFFIVNHSYMDRAVKFVRLDGTLGFSAGSSCDDVIQTIRDYGFVPRAEMTGMQYGTQLPVQSELDAVLRAYVDVIVKKPNGTLTTAWKRGLQGVLDAYLGKCPETFKVDGKDYTPQSYRDALNFKPEDYVSLQSFSHIPFYKEEVIEVCDNWRWGKAYNVPIDELMNVLDAALNAGYTVAWGADVSEAGFTRDGYAILVDVEATNNSGSDQTHWVGEDNSEKPAINNIVEKTVTQESRQAEYDNKTMTDDHGMLFYGIAKDQFGNKYYMVKNSWGITGKFDGIWYASENFVKAQTLDIMVHKSALSKDLRTKLGIK